MATLLKSEIRRSGEPMKQAVNRLLRKGLTQTAETSSRPFRIKPFKLNLPAEWTSGSVPELIDMLEGPSTR